ncbi:hypothetical protein GCM10010259_17170 [Streptomyces daghestanicus]|uniref:Uncharacterized protein n=1 Tax=Streptomyces daghestanicus TaxID=66885 RepID=A0ABQ3Q3H6_9ACTN|nr:hypothetical protein GCM10010259_17170 [Streptomyces daghestanicus]GHI31780.1 hypothetical protein Sdagh_35100 [Streptomyces daghestanicus]
MQGGARRTTVKQGRTSIGASPVTGSGAPAPGHRLPAAVPAAVPVVGTPTACGRTAAPGTDRVNMTKNRPVPSADWNGKATLA